MWKEIKSGFALIVAHQRKHNLITTFIYLFIFVYYFRTFFKGLVYFYCFL